MLPVYILIRTSNRPKFFGRMMETIKGQTYPNIVTIVHTDDPRDKYVTGDIILKGQAFAPEYGNGTYNLYNNRLLRAIPDGPGWFHFIDDDDEYAAPDVIERTVAKCKADYVNVVRVKRWNEVIFPKNWGQQKSFQTECFMVHTDHKRKAKWWGHKNGDHHYSKQLTRVLPINWIENIMICRAQEGKGHGKKLDIGHKAPDFKTIFRPEDRITCLGLVPVQRGIKEERIRQGEVKRLPYAVALDLESQGKVKITYPNYMPEKSPGKSLIFFNQ